MKDFTYQYTVWLHMERAELYSNGQKRNFYDMDIKGYEPLPIGETFQDPDGCYAKMKAFEAAGNKPDKPVIPITTREAAEDYETLEGNEQFLFDQCKTLYETLQPNWEAFIALVGKEHAETLATTVAEGRDPRFTA